MNRTEFLNVLKEHGVIFHKHGSRHDIYIHTATGKKVAVPRHNEIKNKFLEKLLNEIPRN
jgi:predicted RNA binding protein YcfA (HicA-like mRNA interferase family)